MRSESRVFLAAATSVGSILEMYDFVIYGFLSSILALLFFPNSNHFVALLATYIIFGVGYFARPIGGLLLGRLSDRLGRRRGLLISVLSMGLPIFLMGLLPTYQTVGVFAPILLLLCRILQGFSVGAEFPSATTYLAEHAPRRQRGFMSSWVFFGINGGIFLASMIGSWVIGSVAHDTLLAYAWRIPFLVGGILAVLSYWVRKRLSETPVYDALHARKETIKNPVATVFLKEKRASFIGMGLIAVMAAGVGVLFLYMPNYLHQYIHFSLAHALLLNSINLLLFTCLIPLMAHFSDCIGRKPIFLIGAIALLVLAYPLYAMMQWQGSSLYVIIPTLVLGLFLSCIIGPIAAILSELYPAMVRATGIGFAYNVSFAVFGGLAPFFVTVLSHSSSAAFPAFYLMATSVISIVAVCFVQDARQNDISH